jgi:hypothetical protein
MTKQEISGRDAFISAALRDASASTTDSWGKKCARMTALKTLRRTGGYAVSLESHRRLQAREF